MKTKPLTSIVVFAAMAHHAPYCAGQGNVVYYGANSNALNVAFVDTNLSQKVQSAIVADLRICLQEWGKESELRLRDNEDSAGYLYNWTRSPHYRKGIAFPRNIVSNGPSGVALQIPETLSDAYTNAFAFAVANSNVVAAAYEFVAFMSSTNFHSVTPNQITNYIFYNKAPPILYDLSFSDITNSLRMQTYHPPSVLGFYHSAEGPATNNLWMSLPSSSVEYGERLNWGQFPPAIWHEGKWKFCIWEENPNYTLP